MTKPIKLTADDFDYIHLGKDIADPESFELIIYAKSELHCNEIKQQILENQEFTTQYKQELKKLQKTSNNSLSLEECDKLIKQTCDNRQAAQKLKNIENVFLDFECANFDLQELSYQIKDILGEKK